VVIRDHNGTFCGAQAKWHDLCVDALMMEALADKEGLEFARQCGVQRVHLETNCLELVRLWKMEGLQRSMIMHLTCDTMHVQPSWLNVHEAKIHYDTSANPRSKTTWQRH
jgi:hypothetical protein